MRNRIALFGLALALMLAGCALPGFNKPEEKAVPLLGSLSLRIGVPGTFAGRTIVPSNSDLPAITNYAITLTRSGSTTVTTTATDAACSVEALDYGDWSIQVDGKTGSAAIVASGTGTVTIASTSATNATVNLDYVVAATGSSGSASVTLLFPSTQGITSVTGSLDGTDISSSLEVVDNGDSTNKKVVFSSSSIVSANPLLSITLKKDDAKLLVWTERIWVYKGITTTASVTLPSSLFAVAPPTPSSITPSCSGYALTLTWPAVSIAESYTLERSTDAGTTWTVVASGTGLPAGTLSKTETISAGVDYLYRVSAVNKFGSSETRSLSSSVALYTVTFSSNLSLAGSTWPAKATTGCAEASPSSVVVLKGGTATLPTPPTYAYMTNYGVGPGGALIPGSYSFGGWSTTSSGSVNFTAATVVTADTTVYAYWKATITYDKNASDASSINPTSITRRPTTVAMPSASDVSSPTRPNYVFAGWRLDQAGTTTLPSVVNGDMTVYAKWTAATFRSVAADSSGSTLVGVKNCLGKILRSTDQGTTWTPLTDGAGATSQEKLWTHVWCSDDGETVLAYYEDSTAAYSQFHMRRNTGSGYSWNRISSLTPTGTINSAYVKLSGDGKTIALVDGANGIDLRVSSDWGNNWSTYSSTSIGMKFTGIAMSTDGKHIIALGVSNNHPYYRVAYYNDNVGTTSWTYRPNSAYASQSSDSGGWNGGFYRSDGSIMLFPSSDGTVWVSVSSDRLTWTREASPALKYSYGFTTVDGNPNGSLIYGINCDYNAGAIQKLQGGVWSIVTDDADYPANNPAHSGSIWPALRSWSDLSASDDGLKLSVVGKGSSSDADFQFWTSADGGANWTKH